MAFDEAFMMRGERTGGRRHLLEAADRCARLENVDSGFVGYSRFRKHLKTPVEHTS